MTSKEALREIKNILIEKLGSRTDLWRLTIPIEQDIKKLEILRKLSNCLSLFTRGEEHSVYNNAKDIDVPLDEREYQLMKKWLEGE